MVSVGRLYGGRRVRRRRRGDCVTALALDWSGVKLAAAVAEKELSWRRLKTSRARREQIAHAYVVATGGRLPTDLNKLLIDMRELIGDVSEGEVRSAIAQTLREVRRDVRRAERELVADALAG